MKDFLENLSSLMLFCSIIVFIAGLINIASNKEKSKSLGLKLVIGSIMCFIIGFSICSSNFMQGSMN